MDDRLAAYVAARWDDLVDHARERCSPADDADDAAAQDLVLSTLTTVATRWWLVPDRDHPDIYVRRKLDRLCAAHNKRRTPDENFQLMHVGVVETTLSGAPDDITASSTAIGTGRCPASEAVAIVARRARRVSRTWQAFGGIAVAAVVAASVSALTRSDTSKPHAAEAAGHIGSVPLVAFPHWPTHFATDVTEGIGAIWTIETRGAAADSHALVLEHDPVSGHVVASYAAPKADDRIAFGFGKIWAWHDATDYPSKTTITTIDTVGDVQAFRTRQAIAITSATFTNGAAWFVEPGTHTLIRFPAGVLADPRRSPNTRARFIVPTSARSILIAEADGTLRQLPDGQVIARSTAPPTLLSPAPGYGIWTGRGNRVSYQASVNAKPAVTITLPLRIAAVVGDPRHGVYIATKSNNPLHYDPYLVYYSPAALRAASPQPTARLNGLVQAERMVASPAGGVVFVTNKGTVNAWDPVGIRPGR
jgi:hypothetical protein